MEYWQQFMQFEHANLALIAVGALLLLWGILKILGSSIKLVLWVIMAALGGTAVAYGLELSNFPINVSQELRDLVGPSRELSVEAMRNICEKLDSGVIPE